MFKTTLALGALAVGGYFRHVYFQETAWHDAAHAALANPPPKPPETPLLALTHWDPWLVVPSDTLEEKLTALRAPIFGYGFDSHPYSAAVIARAFDVHWRLTELIWNNETDGVESLRLQVEIDQLAKRTLVID